MLKGRRTQLSGAITAALFALDNRLGWGLPVEVYVLAGLVILYFLREGVYSAEQAGKANG